MEYTHGANTGELERVATALRFEASRLTTAHQDCSTALTRLRANWGGEDLARLGTSFRGLDLLIEQVAAQVRGMAEELARQAAQQESVSGAGAPSAGAPGGGPSSPAAPGGPDAPGNTRNPLDLLDWVDDLASVGNLLGILNDLKEFRIYRELYHAINGMDLSDDLIRGLQAGNLDEFLRGAGMLGRSSLIGTALLGPVDVVTGGGYDGWRGNTTRVLAGAGTVGAVVVLAGVGGPVTLAVAGGAVIAYGVWSAGNVVVDWAPEAWDFAQDRWDDLKDIDLPDLDVPDLDVPDIDMPDIDMPDIDVPDIDMPDVDMPDDVPGVPLL